MDVHESVARLMSPEGHENPYMFYDALRRAGPLIPLGEAKVGLFGFAAIEQALRNPAVRVQGAEVFDRWGAGWREQPSKVLVAQSILQLDGPGRVGVHRLLTRTLSARRVVALEPAVERLVLRYAEPLRCGGPVDFMTAFAWLLPVAVVCEVLGVPEEDVEWCRQRAAATAKALEFSRGEQTVPEADKAALQLGDYFTALVKERRAAPREDLVTLLAVGSGEERIEAAQLVNNLILLLIAGFETAVNLLGNGMRILLDRPDVAARLRAEPAFASRCVAEVLRFDAPVQAVVRWVVADIEIAGAAVGAGTKLTAFLGAGNRDPQRFDAPGEFRPTRRGKASLSFGGGAHFCIGAALARLQAQTAFPVLLRLFPKLALAGAPTRAARLVMRGYDRLPVTTN